MDDDVVRVAVGLRLGANLCESHTCTCGVSWMPGDTHGLARASEAQDVSPAMASLNDIMWPSVDQTGSARTGSRGFPGHGAAVSPGTSLQPTPSPHPISHHWPLPGQGQPLLEQKQLRC